MLLNLIAGIHLSAPDIELKVDRQAVSRCATPMDNNTNYKIGASVLTSTLAVTFHAQMTLRFITRISHVRTGTRPSDDTCAALVLLHRLERAALAASLVSVVRAQLLNLLPLLSSRTTHVSGVMIHQVIHRYSRLCRTNIMK